MAGMSGRFRFVIFTSAVKNVNCRINQIKKGLTRLERRLGFLAHPNSCICLFDLTMWVQPPWRQAHLMLTSTARVQTGEKSPSTPGVTFIILAPIVMYPLRRAFKFPLLTLICPPLELCDFRPWILRVSSSSCENLCWTWGEEDAQIESNSGFWWWVSVIFVVRCLEKCFLIWSCLISRFQMFYFWLSYFPRQFIACLETETRDRWFNNIHMGSMGPTN